jgi:hypothetical protein
MAAPAHAGDNNRRDLYRTYDYNNDKRLKGKELKNMEKEHAKPYRSLQSFCTQALNKPKKHGVNFPKGEKAKKFKCKARRVDAPYARAWVKEAPMTNKPDATPTHPQHPTPDTNKPQETFKGQQ